MEFDRFLFSSPFSNLEKVTRNTQKLIELKLPAIEKECNSIASASAKGQNPQKVVGAIDTLLRKLKAFKKRLDSYNQEASKHAECLASRWEYVKRKQPELNTKNSAESCENESEDIEMEDVEQQTCSSQLDSQFEFTLGASDDVRIRRMIAEFLLRQGCVDTAREFARKYGIESLLDFDLFASFHSILADLANRSCTKAIEWTGQNRSKLNRLESELELNLHIQEFIELVRKGDELKETSDGMDGISESVSNGTLRSNESAIVEQNGRNSEEMTDHSSESGVKLPENGVISPQNGVISLQNGVNSQQNGSNFQENGTSSIRDIESCQSAVLRTSKALRYAWKHLSKIGEDTARFQEMFSCLVYFDVQRQTCLNPRYNKYFSTDRWDSLRSMFIIDLLRVNDLPQNSMLELVLKCGLGVLKTQNCNNSDESNSNCPACCSLLRSVAAPIIPVRRVNSFLVCRMSGKPIDEHNPPMVTPSGMVYGKQALLNSKDPDAIMCPRTNKRFSLDECRPAYIL
eukprot:147902_1